jgi:hypothetical protein
VYKIALVLVAASLGACALKPGPKSSAVEKRAEQTMLERAHKIIAKRDWPLPAGYHARVDLGHYTPEDGRAPYDDYWVVFDLPRPHRSAAPLYHVEFLKTSGEFNGAYDDRPSVQDEEIAVAKSAFEQRFHREDYTTFAGTKGGTVEVRFMFDRGQRSVLCVVDRATLKVKRFEDRHGQY